MRFILLVLLLSGCAPYVGYRHLSDPSLSNDGYDMACAGIKVEKVLEFKTGVCRDARQSGTLVEVEIDYVFN